MRYTNVVGLYFASYMNTPSLVLIVHNIRSTHNVGAIFRTAECCGVDKLILSGYTPYPHIQNDSRLPHLSAKISRQIHKTALGTELKVPFEQMASPPIVELRSQGYRIVALEQAKRSVPLIDYPPGNKLALLIGEEVNGINPRLLEQCDDVVEIPMYGQKESFNVSVATGMALYELMIRPH